MESSPLRIERVSRLLVLLVVFAAAAELVVARGLMFVRHERLRAGLPAGAEAWAVVASHVTTFTGLLAAAAVASLGLRLTMSRLSPVGRGLVLGFAATVASLGLVAHFVNPQVPGIATFHLAVILGGLTLGALTLTCAADTTSKLAAVLPLTLPPMGMATIALWRTPGPRMVATAVMWGACAAVAAALTFLAWRRTREGPRLRTLGALTYAMSVTVVVAGAAALEPRRFVEFIFFSHGVLLDFRGSLVVFTLALLAVLFAAGVFVSTPADRVIGRPSGEMLGFGLILCLLAGPAPLSIAQSLVLAAGTMALVDAVLATGPAEGGWRRKPVAGPTANHSGWVRAWADRRGNRPGRRCD